MCNVAQQPGYSHDSATKCSHVDLNKSNSFWVFLHLSRKKDGQITDLMFCHFYWFLLTFVVFSLSDLWLLIWVRSPQEETGLSVAVSTVTPQIRIMKNSYVQLKPASFETYGVQFLNPVIASELWLKNVAPELCLSPGFLWQSSSGSVSWWVQQRLFFFMNLSSSSFGIF